MGEHRRAHTFKLLSLMIVLTILVLGSRTSLANEPAVHAAPAAPGEHAAVKTPEPSPTPSTVSAAPSPKAPESCAMIEQASGEVHLVTDLRSEFIEVKVKEILPCGVWISSKDGWVDLRFTNRAWVRVSPHSFAQLTGPQGDQLVLYRGNVFVKLPHGAPTWSMVTANARATSQGSTFIVQYDSAAEESRVISLENKTSFENRYTARSQMHVATGELSEMNFKLLRNVPSEAKAVKNASLKALLALFELKHEDIKYYGEKAQAREDKKTPLVEVKEGRAPASLEFADGHAHSTPRVVSHAPKSRQPAATGHQRLKNSVKSSSTGGTYHEFKAEPEDLEKKRILQELSTFSVED